MEYHLNAREFIDFVTYDSLFRYIESSYFVKSHCILVLRICGIKLLVW